MTKGTAPEFRDLLNLCKVVLFVKFTPCDDLYFAGKSPFDLEENQLNSGNLDQTVPNIGTPPRVSPSSQSGVGDRVERFSRKVFVGGLPPDIDEGNQCT